MANSVISNMAAAAILDFVKFEFYWKNQLQDPIFARDSIYAIARSLYVIAILSGRLSVWPSVTRVDCTKTVEARIMIHETYTTG